MFFELNVKIFNLFFIFNNLNIEVVPNKNCTGVTAYIPIIQEWTETEPYKTYYKFLFRSVVSTFFPFFLSFYFNIRIVISLNQQHTAARLFRFATSDHRVWNCKKKTKTNHNKI